MLGATEIRGDVVRLEGVLFDWIDLHDHTAPYAAFL